MQVSIFLINYRNLYSVVGSTKLNDKMGRITNSMWRTTSLVMTNGMQKLQKAYKI